MERQCTIIREDGTEEPYQSLGQDLAVEWIGDDVAPALADAHLDRWRDLTGRRENTSTRASSGRQAAAAAAAALLLLGLGQSMPQAGKQFGIEGRWLACILYMI